MISTTERRPINNVINFIALHRTDKRYIVTLFLRRVFAKVYPNTLIRI